MAIRKIFEKLKAQEDEQEPKGRRLSADEMELAVFKERERRDNLKKELMEYRKKDHEELIFGTNILNQPNILNAPNVFRKKKKREVRRGK